MRRGWLTTLCVAVLALAAAAPAGAEAPDPDFTFNGAGAPTRGFEGPCGLTVDVAGNIYVSNYYHDAVNFFSSNGASYPTQLPNVDPVDGPCGLAVDNSGRLYVNDYHRWVQKFTIGGFPSFSRATTYTPGPVIDSSTPTGVAVDPVSGNVYVNARDHIAAYDSSGAPLLSIGSGVLRDGYGIAFSPAGGSLYVADYADNTVKVFSSLSGALLATINGIGVPSRSFVSLRDSALAVDRANGDVYVTDAVGSPLSERPEAIVYVFDSTGAYKGQLKYRISTASPPGLAVDNSTNPTNQGKVYVTSGITEQAVVYAYPRGSATSTSLPTQFSLGVTSGGSGDGSVSNEWAGVDCDSSCEAEIRSGVSIPLTATPQPGSAFTGWSGAGCEGAGECTVEMDEAKSVSASFEALAGPPAPDAPPAGAPSAGAATSSATATTSEIAQKGNLRVTVDGKLSPKRLPRKGTAPIAVSVGGDISTTDGTLAPRLKAMRIELNRRGRLFSTGLPTCKYSKIQPGSSSRALAQCRAALVGKGSFTANITLAGQEPYPTRGRLLVFNSLKGRKPVLYGHIFSAKPFATSFVIVFKIQRLRKGTYGISLNAPLPKAMDSWGTLTGLEMTLSRRYGYKGRRRSFISSGCPAPRGFPGAVFPLARASFSFAGGAKLSSVFSSTCKVRR